ncbi:MurR/RpiR family transcriptional regulator [uncultured Cetobacterium sp.]|uniref:MurR/RpiR family transcriptional regulator n=1 Tax=uncultured Cetobacterium sp. TaxID=527638 RepID=UPI002622AC60|nr:MurR/RpiR family transcriptional regulator [uncultured Cetobacterium sp.]
MEIDIYKLGERYNLTESEELALSYIVNNIEKALEVGVRGVAKECFASTSVVMNLSKKLGYKGFIDMVYRLESSLLTNHENSVRGNDYCLDFSLQKSMKFKNLLRQSKKGPIFIHGVGFSNHIARYIKDKLMILGYYAMMSEYMENVERGYQEQPLLIVVSKSGETSALLNLCQKAKAKQISLILLCGIPNSSIEEISDLTFIIKNSNILDDRNLDDNDFFGNTILFFEKVISQ